MVVVVVTDDDTHGSGGGMMIEDPLLMQYATGTAKSAEQEEEEEHIIIFSEDQDDDDDDASSSSAKELQSLASTVVSAESGNDDDDDDDGNEQDAAAAAAAMEGFVVEEGDDADDDDDDEQSVILDGIAGYVENFCSACEAKRCDLGTASAFRGFCNMGMGNCAEVDDIIDDEIQAELETLKKKEKKKQQRQAKQIHLEKELDKKQEKTNLAHSKTTGEDGVVLVSSNEKEHAADSSGPRSTTSGDGVTIAAAVAEEPIKQRDETAAVDTFDTSKQEKQPPKRNRTDNTSKYSQEVQDILEDLSRVTTTDLESAGTKDVNSKDVSPPATGSNDKEMNGSSLVKMMLEVKQKDEEEEDGIDRELSGLVPHEKPVLEDDDYSSTGTVEVSLLPKLLTTVVVTTTTREPSSATSTGSSSSVLKNEYQDSSNDHDHGNTSLSKFSTTIKSFVESSFKKKNDAEIEKRKETKMEDQKRQPHKSSPLDRYDDASGSGSVIIDVDAFDVSTAKLHANTVRSSVRSSRSRLLSFGGLRQSRTKEADVKDAQELQAPTLADTKAGGGGTSSASEGLTFENDAVTSAAALVPKNNNIDSMTKTNDTLATEENADEEEHSLEGGFEIDTVSGNFTDVHIMESSMKSTGTDSVEDEESRALNVTGKDVSTNKQSDIVVAAETEIENNDAQVVGGHEEQLTGAAVSIPVDPPGNVYDDHTKTFDQQQDEDEIIASDLEKEDSSLEVVASDQLLSESSKKKKKNRKLKISKKKMGRFMKKAFSRNKASSQK